MPVVVIPAALRRRMKQPAPEVPVEAATVGAALDFLLGEHPELKESLYEEDGSLRGMVRIFAGEVSIDQLEGLDTAVGPREEILLLPPIAGG